MRHHVMAYGSASINIFLGAPFARRVHSQLILANGSPARCPIKYLACAMLAIMAFLILHSARVIHLASITGACFALPSTFWVTAVECMETSKLPSCALMKPDLSMLMMRAGIPMKAPEGTVM